MDLRQPTNISEAQELIGMVQYYRDMWNKRSHALAPMTEAVSGTKGKKILE